jgi:hypothetical protein
MYSTKRYLPVLAIGFVFLIATSVAAQDQKQAFVSNLGMNNPCNNSFVQVQGPTKIGVSADDGGPVGVHFQIEANGQDESGNPYRTNVEGNGQFDTAAPYDFPFHSVWVGQQGAPSFTLNGTVEVFKNDQGDWASQIIAIDPPACTN